MFLTCLPADFHWKTDQYFRSIFEGAREQAERYGFSLSEIRVTDYARDMTRLNKVLITRNVQGLWRVL